MADDTKIALVKNAVLELKKKGVPHVAVEALLDYLTKLEGTSGRPELSAAELEHYKAQLPAWAEAQRAASAIGVEGFRSGRRR